MASSASQREALRIDSHVWLAVGLLLVIPDPLSHSCGAYFGFAIVRAPGVSVLCGVVAPAVLPRIYRGCQWGVGRLCVTLPFRGALVPFVVRRAFAFVLRPLARGACRRWPSVCYGTPLEVVAPSYSSFRPLWRRACSSGRRLRAEVLKPWTSVDFLPLWAALHCSDWARVGLSVAVSGLVFPPVGLHVLMRASSRSNGLSALRCPPLFLAPPRSARLP